MIGLILISLGTFFEEISNAIGKKKVGQKLQTVYSFGVLQLVSGTAAFGLIALLNSSSFVFSLGSLPTFIPRLILEIVGLHVTLLAIVRADRTTFSFVRVGTIPLLLVMDIVLQYSLKTPQVAGMAIILVTLAVVFLGKQISKGGLGLVAFSTLNSVATITLYKYNITHFNSVVAEELLVYFALLLYLSCVSWFKIRENPYKLFLRPLYLTQSLSYGLTVVFVSFAYLFAPASVITAGKRASSLLWSLVVGNVYFGESKLFAKLIIAAFLISGLVLLAM